MSLYRAYSKPQINFVGRWDVRLGIESIVELEGSFDRVRIRLQTNQHGDLVPIQLQPYLASLQEAHSVQGLLDIRHLVLQPCGSSLLINLHELVFAANNKLVFRLGSSYLCDVRDHLLEALQRSLDISSRGDIVLDLVYERRIWNASRIRGGDIFPGTSSITCLTVRDDGNAYEQNIL